MQPLKRNIFLQELSEGFCHMSQIWHKETKLVAESQKTLNLANVSWLLEIGDCLYTPWIRFHSFMAEYVPSKFDLLSYFDLFLF